MRILFIVGRFPVLSQTFVINQVAGAAARGHDVSIYEMSTDPEKLCNTHPDVMAHDLLSKTFRTLKVPHAWGPRLKSAAHILATTRGTDRFRAVRLLNVAAHGRVALSLRLLHVGQPLIGRGRFDIIHCQFGPYALRALILRRVGIIEGRLVTSFRGYDISSFVRESGEHVYDRLFAEGDWFLANCDFFRNRAIALGCDPTLIRTLGSGIDLRCFPYRPRGRRADQRTRLATVGRLVEKKGIGYAIEAVAALLVRGHDIDFRIIGDGPLRNEYQSLIKRLGVTDRVTLLGAMDQPEIVRVLGDSDIFIGPSVTARNGDQDAPTNALKEAMALGMPVVATRHGGIPELVEDGVSGFLMPERDSCAIVAAVEQLITQPERWAEMGRAGRATVEARYDNERLNDELIRMYEALLPRPQQHVIEAVPTAKADRLPGFKESHIG
jgi:colanic acid/amylovoran/stewartan biosynthesis glycosyltransferase WcaL/AmsK/CpsK